MEAGEVSGPGPQAEQLDPMVQARAPSLLELVRRGYACARGSWRATLAAVAAQVHRDHPRAHRHIIAGARERDARCELRGSSADGLAMPRVLVERHPAR